jgi:hypothetical protein
LQASARLRPLTCLLSVIYLLKSNILTDSTKFDAQALEEDGD